MRLQWTINIAHNGFHNDICLQIVLKETPIDQIIQVWTNLRRNQIFHHPTTRN